MMRYLTLEEVLALHRLVIERSGGLDGLRDVGVLESALVQPRMSFEGQELYPELADKAAALGYSLVLNHPFLDGNKRVGHAAMETFLVLNGWELDAELDVQEQLMLRLASGQIQREEFASWVRAHLRRHPEGA